MTNDSLPQTPKLRTLTLSTYEPIARALLKRHKLGRIPRQTVEAVTKVIYKSLVVHSRLSLREPDSLTPRERLVEARKAANKILSFRANPPSRRATLSRQARNLRSALGFVGVGAWLAPIAPLPQIQSYLTKLGRLERSGVGGPTKVELAQLMEALDQTLSLPSKTTGRPRALVRLIVDSACVVWRRSKPKRPLSCSWDLRANRVRGTLAVFIRDYAETCGVKVSEHALYSAMRVTLKFANSRLSIVAANPLGKFLAAGLPTPKR